MPGKKPSSPPPPPRRTVARTNVWDIEIERYGLIGYTTRVAERESGRSCSEYTFTRWGARRWSARYIRAERRARARTPERFTVAPEDLV